MPQPTSMPAEAKRRLHRAMAASVRHFRLGADGFYAADEAAKADPWGALKCYEAIARSLVPR